MTNVQLWAESGQELVIGGYGPGAHGFDIVGYYRGKELVYIALVRNGFVRRKDTIVPNVPSCTKIVR